MFFFKYPATTEIYTYLRTLSLHDALPILRHRRDHHRDVELIVHRPAPENIAIFLDRHEGVARPVLGVGLDDVHMAEQYDRLLLRRSVQGRGEGRGLAHRGARKRVV